MKYTQRLKGMIEAITDIEDKIDSNKSQIEYHQGNLYDENGEVKPYHEEMIAKYTACNSILELALDWVKELDIRRVHEFDEGDINQPILYEAVDIE